MEIKYKRQHNESYMVLEVNEESLGYEEKMIEENQLSSLLKFSKVNFNGVQQYNYCISRKENLEDYLEGRELTLELLKRIILNIQLGYEEIAKYLIDENHIYLSKETVFLEKSNDSFRLSLCYYPSDLGSVQQQFRSLMEFFLQYVSSRDKQITDAVYKAYDLCLKNDYTISEILECLQSEDNDYEVYVERIDPYAETIESVGESYEDPLFTQTESLNDWYEAENSKKSGKWNTFLDSVKGFINNKINFEDLNYDSSDDFVVDPDYEIEEKTVLLTDVNPSGKLVYDGQNQEDDFLVNKDIFRIGSGKGNDAILKAKTVSSNHAKIEKEGNDYYITDLNSTNSTFVNNVELPYRTKVKLKIMDKISFANVNYTFW